MLRKDTSEAATNWRNVRKHLACFTGLNYPRNGISIYWENYNNNLVPQITLSTFHPRAGILIQREGNEHRRAFHVWHAKPKQLPKLLTGTSRTSRPVDSCSHTESRSKSRLTPFFLLPLLRFLPFPHLVVLLAFPRVERLNHTLL